MEHSNCPLAENMPLAHVLDSIADRDVEFVGQKRPGMQGEHAVADEFE